MIPTIASACIQRWALTLSMYEYYVPLDSRVALPTQIQMAPLPDTPVETPQPSELVLLMEHLSTCPVTAVQIKRMTWKDPILSRMAVFFGATDSSPYNRISGNFRKSCTNPIREHPE